MTTKPNLRTFDRIVRLALGALLLFAAAVLFRHPFARILSALAGLFALYECVTSTCPLYARLGARSPGKPLGPAALFLLGLFGVQGTLAYEWWTAGWEKISTPDFVVGISKTLEFFAGKNPFPWYVSFLRNIALPNASAFAYAVEWSQLGIGLALAAAIVVYLCTRDEDVKRGALILSVLALLGGALMNASFYLAAAWTSPATRGSNVVMFWAGMTLIFVWLTHLTAGKRR